MWKYTGNFDHNGTFHTSFARRGFKCALETHFSWDRTARFTTAPNGHASQHGWQRLGWGKPALHNFVTLTRKAWHPCSDKWTEITLLDSIHAQMYGEPGTGEADVRLQSCFVFKSQGKWLGGGGVSVPDGSRCQSDGVKSPVSHYAPL